MAALIGICAVRVSLNKRTILMPLKNLEDAWECLKILQEHSQQQKVISVVHRIAITMILAEDEGLKENIRWKIEQMEAHFIASSLPDDLLEVMREEFKQISGG